MVKANIMPLLSGWHCSHRSLPSTLCSPVIRFRADGFLTLTYLKMLHSGWHWPVAHDAHDARRRLNESEPGTEHAQLTHVNVLRFILFLLLPGLGDVS